MHSLANDYAEIIRIPEGATRGIEFRTDAVLVRGAAP